VHGGAPLAAGAQTLTLVAAAVLLGACAMQLAGVRLKKRKKDIKAKFEPEEFRDQLVAELKPVANESPEVIGKVLDNLSEKADYRTYGETLFDILFTGGILGAPPPTPISQSRHGTTLTCRRRRCGPPSDRRRW